MVAALALQFPCCCCRWYVADGMLLLLLLLHQPPQLLCRCVPSLRKDMLRVLLLPLLQLLTHC